MKSIECYDGDCDICVESPEDCSCGCHVEEEEDGDEDE